MKFKIIAICLFIYSCNTTSTHLEYIYPYNSNGFAYVYNEMDYKKKIIKGKLDNNKLQISIPNLRTNTLVKIINPRTNDSLILRNTKKIKFPDFYKILITQMIADKLNINIDTPLVEILEIKKNKSFIAKKAKIFNEEKTISSNAPITSVKISNISKNKPSKDTKPKDDFYILIATFYSNETAEFLKKRIIKEIPYYDHKKLKILKKSNKESNLISGPYNTINLMKNDYINLKKFGFEELNIITND